jgi:hypothetical protein
MNRCRKLKEYATFIACIRKYQNEEKDIRTAIDLAVEECIEMNCNGSSFQKRLLRNLCH